MAAVLEAEGLAAGAQGEAVSTWKLSDAEKLAAWDSGELADIAGRKALLWAAERCDAMASERGAAWGSDARILSAALREAAKP